MKDIKVSLTSAELALLIDSLDDAETLTKSDFCGPKSAQVRRLDRLASLRERLAAGLGR